MLRLAAWFTVLETLMIPLPEHSRKERYSVIDSVDHVQCGFATMLITRQAKDDR